MFFYFVLSAIILLQLKLRSIAIVFIILTFVLTFQYEYKSLSGNEVGYFLIATHYMYFFISGVLIGQITQANFFKSIRLEDRKTIPILITVLALAIFFINITPKEHLLTVELVICMSLILLCSISPASASSQISRKRNIIIQAGDGSYSTYLFHGFILGVMSRLVASIEFAINPYLFALLMTLICTVIGIIIYRVVEKPLLNFLNQKATRFRPS